MVKKRFYKDMDLQLQVPVEKVNENEITNDLLKEQPKTDSRVDPSDKCVKSGEKCAAGGSACNHAHLSYESLYEVAS